MPDAPLNNWVCKTDWIRPSLPESLRPRTSGDEWLGEIQIEWNINYFERREFWASLFVEKEVWIRQVEKLLPKVGEIAQKAVELLERYKSGKIGIDELQRTLGRMELDAIELFQEAGMRGEPPLDCQECDSTFLAMVGDFYDIFIAFRTRGQANWNWDQKLWIMQDAIRRYAEEKASFLHEWKKLGKRW